MGKYIERSPNFFMDFFVEQKIPKIYSKIRFGNEILYSCKDPDGAQYTLQGGKAYSVALIPEYLDLEVFNPEAFTSTMRKQTNLGYSIRLTKGFNIDSYLKDQLKSNYRNLKKRQARLETCYNIDYRLFFGEISEGEYQYLMQCLHSMLVRRFEQRNDVNEQLKEWTELLAKTKSKVNEKKASLFVIYDDEVPIDISLNYHFSNIMFGSISSYDIDYSKFGLGSIEKIKLLEWCLSNSYKLLDFGYGDLEYKKVWSNYVYNFKYQVISGSKSFPVIALSKLESVKLCIKEYLKSKKIDILYKRIKLLVGFKRNEHTIQAKKIEYEESTISDSHNYADLKKVDFHKLESSYPIKSIINNFIYATRENKNSVELLKILNEQNSFLVKGEKKVQKITFKI